MPWDAAIKVLGLGSTPRAFSRTCQCCPDANTWCAASSSARDFHTCEHILAISKSVLSVIRAKCCTTATSAVFTRRAANVANKLLTEMVGFFMLRGLMHVENNN